ncbi:uracil-DNA glycosylase family protein [Thiomicrorhabdus sp.]|uniref:uracil-DNA glycosylase family protein n=1 Tax=Thiomicrorhabdus sp. TaxID=2039724 RepID=UPI0029C9583D|nr:uracil-DNA glycosylase family protein [Thiomicrorhabdus sp.]
MIPTAVLLEEIRHCRICEAALPHEPRPVLQYHPDARILIAGQAPGRKVHASGIPFDDASGDRLREWMGIDRQQFYDSQSIAILPMGFCYPGSGRSGDLPPRPECAIAWRQKLLERMDRLEMTLVIGRYAQGYHFGKTGLSVTDLVRNWQDYWPDKIPLPHPSPRNNIWLKKNPWFEEELLPELRQRVEEVLA